MVTKKQSALQRFKPSRSAFARTKSTGSLGGLKKSRSNNRISFGSASTLVFERQIQDEDHKNAIWFSNEEMKDIKRDVVISIKRGDNCRGLEKYQGGDFGKGAREKRQIYTKAILTMHRDQRRFGIRDEQSIEMLSRAMSCDDLNRAQQLASMDSAHALLEHMNSLSLMPTEQQQQQKQQPNAHHHADHHHHQSSSSSNSGITDKQALDNFRRKALYQQSMKTATRNKDIDAHMAHANANATFEPKTTTAATTTPAFHGAVPNPLFEAMAKRRQQLSNGAA